MFLGVRRESGELIVIDQATNKMEHAHTARRVPEEQRWGTENWDWARAVPWRRPGG